MYTISKISTNSWHENGTPVYDKERDYPTWRAMVRSLEYNPTFLAGFGSHVYCNGELLGSTDQLYRIPSGGYHGEKPVSAVTLNDFLNNK